MLRLTVAALLWAVALSEPGAEQQSMQAMKEAFADEEARHLLELEVSLDIFNDDDIVDVHQSKPFPGADSTGTPRRQQQQQQESEERGSLQPHSADTIDIDASSHGSWSNLVYIKIPKTASSTFAGVLHRVGSRYGLTGADSCTHTWGKEPLLWAEHASYSSVKDKVENLKEKSIVVTLVRDPLDRCLSHYYYTRHGRTPSTASKLDFMRSRCSNYQTAFMGEDKNWRNLSSADEVIQRYDYIGLSDHFDESAIMLAHTLGVSDDDVAYISIKIADGRDAEDGTGTGTLTVRHPPFSEEPPEVKTFVASREWKDANALDYAIVKHANAQLSGFFNKADARNRLQRFVALRNREIKRLTAEDGTFDTTAAYESKLLLDCRLHAKPNEGSAHASRGAAAGLSRRAVRLDALRAEGAAAAADHAAKVALTSSGGGGSAHAASNKTDCDLRLTYCLRGNHNQTTGECNEAHRHCVGAVKKREEKAKEEELEAAAAQAEKDAAIAEKEAEMEAVRAAKAAKTEAVKEVYSKVADPKINTNCAQGRTACEAAQTASPASKTHPLDLGCLAKYKGCVAREARRAAAHEDMLAQVKQQEKAEREREKEAREKEKAKTEAADAKKVAKEKAAAHMMKAKESLKKATAEAKEAASSSSSSSAAAAATHTVKAKAKAKAHVAPKKEKHETKASKPGRA